MKELMKILKNKKGISLITLSVAVSVLIIITGTLIYNAKDTVEVRNLKNMYNDIEFLEDKVEAYYSEYGSIPGNKVYENTNFLKGTDETENTEDDIKNSSDSGNYYVIDLVSLDGITTLNYGRDYENRDKEDFSTSQSYNDIYIINEGTHQIYYVRGIEADGKRYYTNEFKSNANVDIYITAIDSIEDLVRFQQKVSGGETFEGKYVVLTRNLDFEDDSSYDGSKVTINGTSYSLNGTNNLKNYGWSPIDSDRFNGTFKENGYSVCDENGDVNIFSDIINT